VDKQFNQYQHPFQQGMKKGVILEMEVMVVVGKGEALANHSLQEPRVRLATPEARPIATTAEKKLWEAGAGSAGADLLRVECVLARAGKARKLMQTRAFSTFTETG